MEYSKIVELGINIPSDITVSNTSIVAEGTIFRLKRIYYNFNDASIRPDAHEDLDAVVAMMTKFPDMEIELASHTDSRGTETYNKDLSQRRANSAAAATRWDRRTAIAASASHGEFVGAAASRQRRARERPQRGVRDRPRPLCRRG